LLDNPHSPEVFAELLALALDGMVILSPDQLRLLEAHYQLLLRWNARMSLTTVTSMSEAVVRHYAESIFLGQLLLKTEADADDRLGIVDIGSGAGFPGIPIAVLRPTWRVTLVESNQRKAVFLAEASRELSNVGVKANRAQEIAGTWDWVVSRAVRPADVAQQALRLGRRIGLLMGAEDVERLPSNIGWQDPVQLPWGERRVAITGEVPRGT
jgi:16S rRNA (guanine527-N7)-methyltransferase